METLTKTKIAVKTIDIQAKEWFDKVNGNSYFSAIITLNFGMEDEKTINVPFQYGYGDHYKTVAFHQLQTAGYLGTDTIYNVAGYCMDKGILLRYSKKEKCLKREVVNWVM